MYINGILYSAAKKSSSNNVIEGNIIKGFGYGIFSLGMGAHLDDQVNVTTLYNKNNKFINNFIEDVFKGGIFLGFEENALISKNRINNVYGS